ncbi:MAG TPA: M48 family metallopeptidase [Blastocatellia bacterium]|nr:M48 family metallopeptidase [Blastocatellia bacterium]
MPRQKFAAIMVACSLLSLQAACGGLSNRSSPFGGGRAEQAPHFKPGFNLFKPEQDIELGVQSAQKIAQQVPISRDEMTVNYVRQLGARLASKAPGHKFPYQFNVIATKDINAFALPGGFIFVNAGAIMAAGNEGELAGVIAHEIVHVALRHGTSQATKAYIAKAGLGILSTIAGGDNPESGQIINVIGGAGANALFLKFGRTAETQADLEGARIMAEAGYDPRDMAAFFKTLQERGGQRVPEFLSDHPDPGNRVAAINEVLPSLPMSKDPTHDSQEFEQVKARLLGSGGEMRQSAEPARLGSANPGGNKAGVRVEPPSQEFAGFQARDNSFAIQYPRNWDALTSDEVNMIFAPKGAYARTDQSVVVTHGIFIGAVEPEGKDLESATSAYIRKQVEGNPDFRVVRDPQEITFGGRRGYATVVAGPSTVTGVMEIDVIYTSVTSEGRLFYLITIAPEDEIQQYRSTFEAIIKSLQLAGAGE